ncbi:MAG: glycosyltransferase family 4 protein, partial [Acidobacteria bacterium]|nr:glycosyltransferase family 4 protein [Acidobacteriota bacterium]
MPAWLWKLLGKDPDAAVVYFASGDAARVRAMYEEIHALEPGREHIVVCQGREIDGLPCRTWNGGPLDLGSTRIGLAPFLLGAKPHPLRTLAFRSAPHHLLAFNERGERHHLRADIASLLFWRGVPLDRIWLRPRWWPWARERSREAREVAVWAGRPLTGRPRVGIVAPYFPWPLGHGGAVRIHALLREAAKEFDVNYYCFAEPGAEPGPVMDWVHQAVLFDMPRYREPRWASFAPPEVREFRSQAMLERIERDALPLVQAEYTHLARYAKGVVVAHDVTYDLYEQIERRQPSLANRWNAWRWRRFEKGIRGKLVVMAGKDAPLLDNTVVIPNGVDLERFRPAPEPDSQRVLFVGSFRHFPNVTAFRFLREEVWPLVLHRVPGAELEVVAGPHH